MLSKYSTGECFWLSRCRKKKDPSLTTPESTTSSHTTPAKKIESRKPSPSTTPIKSESNEKKNSEKGNPPTQVQEPSVPLLDSILNGSNTSSKKQIQLERIEPNQENVEKLWLEFLDTIDKEKDSYFLSFAKTIMPQWKTPNILLFEFKSSIAQGTITNNKSHFIPFFLKRLQLENLQFESKIDSEREIIKPKKASTVVDRLKEAEEQNPAIIQLINRLDLDFYKNG